MSENDDSYAATKDDEEKFYYAFGGLDYVKGVAEKWNADLSDGTNDSCDIENDVAAEEDVFSHHTALSDTLRSAVDFCLSQYQILLLLSSIESSLYLTYINNNIIKKLEKDGELVSEEGGAKIFRMDSALSDKIHEADKRGEVLRIGGQKIGPSVFLGMVASFDALIVDIVGKLIQANPTRYISGEKSISISDVVGAASIEEILKEFVSDELYKFSRESHEVQNSYVENKFAIKIKDAWKRYPDYIEVFERRNLIAHGESRFNSRYTENCEKAGHKGVASLLGEPVELRLKYQKQAIYLLSEYAILLSFVLWRKHASEKENDAFETLNEASYKLIQDGHYELADRILSFALSLKNAEVSEEVRKMMVVNRASAASGKDNIEAGKKILEAEDWSASSLQFQISVAALRGEMDKVIELMPTAQKMGFSVLNFRTWPVFRFIRDKDDFNDALEASYGERIKEKQEIVDQESIDDNVDDATLH